MLSTLRYNAWQQKHTNLILFPHLCFLVSMRKNNVYKPEAQVFFTVFLLLDQYDVIKNGYTLYRHVSDTLKHL